MTNILIFSDFFDGWADNRGRGNDGEPRLTFSEIASLLEAGYEVQVDLEYDPFADPYAEETIFEYEYAVVEEIIFLPLGEVELITNLGAWVFPGSHLLPADIPGHTLHI